MPTQFVNDEGIAQVLMINEGQGASAYYEKEQLARDGSAFDGGLVFIDHPGRQESKDRPERSLKDLVGPIVGTPTFDENGSEGPGLYAGVKVAPWWKPFLEHHGLILVRPSVRVVASDMRRRVGSESRYVRSSTRERDLTL